MTPTPQSSIANRQSAISKSALDLKDVERFYRLYHSLLAFANRRLNVIRGVETREQVNRSPI